MVISMIAGARLTLVSARLAFRVGVLVTRGNGYMSGSGLGGVVPYLRWHVEEYFGRI